MEEKWLILRKIISKQLGIELEQIKPNSDFRNELAAYHYDIIEIILIMKEELDIEFDDSPENLFKIAEKIFRPSDLLNYFETPFQ